VAAAPDGRFATAPPRGRLAVDGVAEHVQHAREHCLADRRFERAARVIDRAAAGQPLGGGQRNPAHAMRVELGRNLNGDLASAPARSRV